MKKPISCAWQLIPTPIWILGILDCFLDPKSNEDQIAETPLQSPVKKTQALVLDQLKLPGDKEVIPDTQRNLMTQAEEIDDGVDIGPVHEFKADKRRMKVGQDMKMYLDYFDDMSEGNDNELDLIEEENKEVIPSARQKKVTFGGLDDDMPKDKEMKTAIESNHRMKVDEDGMFGLRDKWYANAGDNELSNTNYWLHHLDESLSLLTKKNFTLYDYKFPDNFFTNQILQKVEMHSWQKTFLVKSTSKRLEFFKANSKIKDKYRAWHAIEHETKSKIIEQSRDTDEIIQLVGGLEGTLDDQNMGEEY